MFEVVRFNYTKDKYVERLLCFVPSTINYGYFCLVNWWYNFNDISFNQVKCGKEELSVFSMIHNTIIKVVRDTSLTWIFSYHKRNKILLN